MSWRTLTAEDLEREYSPSSCVGGDIAPFLSEYVRQSQAARDACAAAGLHVAHLRYGEAPRQIIHFVRPQAAGPVPLLVFIHGGYWQDLSPGDSFFAAADGVRHDLAFAAIGYTLAPEASLDEIVAEVMVALAHLVREAAALGIDPAQVVVTGSSAGAHLAAMASIAPTTAAGWRPKAMVLVSGIYELEPLLGTYINDALALDLPAAKRNSPVLLPLAGAPRAHIVHGDNETDEFKRQSADMHHRLRSVGVDATLQEIADRNHFDVILDLARRGEDLGEAVLDLLAAPVNAKEATDAEL